MFDPDDGMSSVIHYKLWSDDMWERNMRMPGRRKITDFHTYQETTHMWTAEKDRHVARALGRAIRHVRRVSQRPHIQSSREERLNQFVVSIRRELSQIRGTNDIDEATYSSCNYVLANKECWYDVGELNVRNRLIHSPLSQRNSVPISNEDVKRWLKLSRHLESETEAQAYDIATDIEEISQGVGTMEDSVDEIQQINQEGDELAGKLAELFS